MMKILVIVLSFLTLTFGLLLLQPGVPGQAVTAMRDVVEPAPASMPAPMTVGQVTRAQTELIQIAAAPIRPVLSAPAPQPRVQIAARQGGDDLRVMTNDILAGLGIAPSAAIEPNAAVEDVQFASLTVATGDAAQRSMTNSVLSGLRAATTKPTRGESIQTIIVQALREGQSDAYIDALLNEATMAGRIQVPAALVTNTGKVDTSIILASIIEGATGKPQARAAAVGGPGVEVRVVQRIDGTVQYQFYTVQPGDSLGAIAVKFYGDMRRYTTIYEANRQVLLSPDRIRAGQRLSIPAL